MTHQIGFDNGGWNRELAGFWIAKYEMSMETDGISTKTSSSTIGNVATNDKIKIVSKPNVSSWRYINIANCYTNSYHYDRKKESHLMKNSEWGACAYLTHSQYGRNRNEVTINNSNNYITGSAESIVAGNSTTYAYNTEAGMLASSTGNIYGVYDLSGGAYEYVASFNSAYSGAYYTDSAYLDSNGNHFAITGGSSTKYITVYNNNTSTSYGNFSVGRVSIPGDAIKEVWVSSDRAWFYDYSHFIYKSNPFFRYGGMYSSATSAGIFCSYSTNGGTYGGYSFRVVLAD